MDSAQSNLRPGAVQRWLESWRRRRELQQDFAGCDSVEVDRMLHDLGLTREDLDSLARCSYGPESLMPKRLAAEGIDPDKLQRLEAAIYRDMQRVCSSCRSTARCERDLVSADAIARDWRDYCLNADTIDALTAEKRAP